MVMQEQDEELFRQWREHPVTIRLLQWAERRREALKEGWANGEFTAAFDIEMMAKNAAATGAVSIYKELIDISSEDLFGDGDGK